MKEKLLDQTKDMLKCTEVDFKDALARIQYGYIKDIDELREYLVGCLNDNFEILENIEKKNAK